MKKLLKSILFSVCIIFSGNLIAQNYKASFDEVVTGSMPASNDATHPCITAAEYESLNALCARNRKLLGLDKSIDRTSVVALEWPLRAAAGFTDCSHYAISAHVDQNTASGVFEDYNCGTIAYDGHHGTDIMTYPFGFYKMENNQVEIIAAAAGTILAKDDGNFDRNCASNTTPANYVIIQHADGSEALYWHMKSGSVTTKAVGQSVAVGEYLGVPGTSGSSSGPHLHFEVWSGSTNTTYQDPFAGSCNTLNANSWWAVQKPYTEPSILKASVHTTDVVIPACPATETPNESTSYTIPFQGPGLPAGYAKFYIFIRNATVGMTATMRILNPGGSVYNTWTYSSAAYHNASYAGWSKLLPTTAGTYTFQAVYNGITCAQNFEIIDATGISERPFAGQLQISPNPGTDLFQVSAESLNAGIYTLELKNVIGQLVLRDRIETSSGRLQKTISLEGMPKGIYFLVLGSENKRISGRLVKL